MRLGFDCAKLCKGRGKSIGIYNVTKSVITNLLTVIPKDVQIVVFGNEYNKCDFGLEGVEFIDTRLNIDSKKDILLWELFKVNSFIKEYKIDKIVFPRGFDSINCPVTSVIILHDLIPFYYKKNYPKELGLFNNTYITMRLKQSIKSADRIITISEYSKKDAVNMVKSSEKKITVILHGFDKRNKLYEVEPASKDYIIGVTSNLQHKNAKGIVKSYIKYCSMSENPVKLVLAGVKDIDSIGVTIPEDIKNNIECKKFLDDREYFSLFKNAKALVFLSYIEGFGLPPLEAMELGVPVICSDKTSLPEVVRDAGILVDPDDYEMVAKSIKILTTDDSVRNDYIEKGYNNLLDFKWEDKIKQYLAVFMEK